MKEVHTWSVTLNVAPEAWARLYATLSQDERDRSARFRFVRDRLRFVTARGTLRALLGRYLRTRPGRIRFSYNAFGKPELSPAFGSRLRFNLSHSAGLALIAITWIGKEYRFLGLDWSYIMILGFIGNLFFSMRFFVQWLASERQGESVIPISFWYWSIAGSVIMCLYFIFRRDPVGILAYLPNSLIYIRNLMLIQKGRAAPTAAAPSQRPRETG